MSAEKSSIIRRELSKEDAIKQFYRPQLQARATQALDIFDRFVSECEMLTTLGTSFQAGREKLLITPDELRANLDEFAELQELATKGRALLKDMGYVSPRTNTPLAGTAPVGKSVDVQPITTQSPGQESLEAVLVTPKAKK